MPVVQRPSPKDRVEQQYHLRLCGSLVPPQHFTDPFQERIHALARRLDQKFVPVLAHVLPEEVEPPGDMRDQRFLGRQLQASNREEFLNGWLDPTFQQLPTHAGHDEVVRIPHDMRFGWLASCLVRPQGRIHRVLQTVQCQIGQHW